MSYANFVHLRVHTAYSMSEGAIATKKIGKMCKDMGMPAVALTDTRNLFAGLEFSTMVAGEGIQPIIGCQLSLRREGDASARGMAGRDAKAPEPDDIVLLCQSDAGYRNLLKLVSSAYLDTQGHETPQISWQSLADHHQDLICLTGGVSGPIGRLLSDNQNEDAKDALQRLAEIFPNRLYVEI